MKIDWDAKLTDLKGASIKDDDNEVTLGTVAVAACTAVLRTDEGMSISDKKRLFTIALSASAGGVAEVATEDVTKIKERVCKMYGALIYGRVDEIIEAGVGKAPRAEGGSEVAGE